LINYNLWHLHLLWPFPELRLKETFIEGIILLELPRGLFLSVDSATVEARHDRELLGNKPELFINPPSSSSLLSSSIVESVPSVELIEVTFPCCPDF
jgi:hypothetical protein